MIVLGIDPGSQQLGWARIDLDAGCFRGGNLERFRGDLPARLAQVQELLPRLMRGVDVVAFEKMFSMSNFGDRALHAVAAAIQCAAADAGVTCYEIPCSTARLIVLGNGGADKDQVEAYVCARFRVSPRAFAAQDVTDAALIALAAPAWPEHRARIRAEKVALKKRRAARKAAKAVPAS